MFLSVIIPVYNVEPYLKNCIESVIKQNLKNEIELLLVDDGSKDSSGKICDEYAAIHPWIKVFHLSNGGVGNARNYGLKHASGEYFTFIDSDDFLDDGFYAEVYQLHQIHPTDAYIFGYKDYPRKANEKEHTPSFRQCASPETLAETYFELKQNYMMFGVLNKIFKRSICGNLKFNTQIHYFEDYLFVLSCLNKIHTLTTIEKAPYNYVHHPGERLGSKYTSPEVIVDVARQIREQSLLLPQSQELTNYTILEYYNNLLHAIDSSKSIKEQLCYTKLLVSEIKKYGLLQDFRTYLGRRKPLLTIPNVYGILTMNYIRNIMLKFR